MCFKKLLNKKLLQVEFEPADFNPASPVAAAVLPLAQKPKIITMCP